jgi:uncharacterized coiled-coil protein SlyX
MTKETLKKRLEELEIQKSNLEIQFQQLLGAIAVTTQYLEDLDAPKKEKKKEKK